MFRRATHLMIVAASLAIGTSFTTSAGAAPTYPIEPGPGTTSIAEQVSFWGLPYPYGYSYRGHRCLRHVRLQTRHGWRWRRVWVCD